MSYNVYYTDGRMKVGRYAGPWYDVDVESGLPVGPVKGGYFKIERSEVSAGWLVMHYMRPPKRRWWSRPSSLASTVLSTNSRATISTEQVVWTALYLLDRVPGASEVGSKWIGTYPPQNVQEVGKR